MRRTLFLLVAAPILTLMPRAGGVDAQAAWSGPAPADPFAFLSPGIRLPDRRERLALEGGRPLVRLLPNEGADIGLLASVTTTVTPERFIEWQHHVEQFRQGRYVSAIHRFSRPPRPDDLRELTLDDRDLEDLRRCEPGDCDLKLSDDEIAGLLGAIHAAGADWKDAAQHAFRAVVLARAREYLRTGHAGATYHDSRRQVSLEREASKLVGGFPFLQVHAPQLVARAQTFPCRDEAGGESFLYWSTETLGARPIVSVNHVSIGRADSAGQPAVIVIAQTVFASHYIDGALSVTALTAPAADGNRYFVYVNRTSVDLLNGVVGLFVRPAIERRLREGVPGVLHTVRTRLEGGAPAPRDGASVAR